MKSLRVSPLEVAVAVVIVAALSSFTATLGAQVQACADAEVLPDADCVVQRDETCLNACAGDVYALACAPDVRQFCQSCSIGIDADCAIACSSECAPGCQDDASATCLDLCGQDCMPDCTIRCGAYQDYVCEGSPNTELEACRAQSLADCESACGALCDFECGTSCAELGGDAGCDEMCAAACAASCTVSPVAPCLIECNVFRKGECEKELSGQCEAGCSANPGSVFCDGQYVYHGGDIAACITALNDLLEEPVAGTTHDAGAPEGNGGCTIGAMPAGSQAAPLTLFLLPLAGARRRGGGRRRKA